MNNNENSNDLNHEIIKGMDLRIVELNDDIVAAINKANLPAQALVYIFADYLNIMRGKATSAVEIQRKEYEEGVKEDGKEIHKD